MKSSKVSLFSSITFFLLGLTIFLRPDLLVKVISFGLGGLLIFLGFYKCLTCYIFAKKLNTYNKLELTFGITLFVLGLIFIFLVDAIELLIRFIVGGWLISMGLSKILNSFHLLNKSSKFYSLLIVGIILILIGLYIVLVSNLALSIIGLFMMLYGLIDFISYFVYKTNNDEIMESKLVESSKKEVIVDAEFHEKK